MSLELNTLTTSYSDNVLSFYNQLYSPFITPTMGLNVHFVDSTSSQTVDIDTILFPSIIPVYQTNLTIISTNNTVITDLNNFITTSNYTLPLVVNNTLANTPNNLYSSLLTDSTIQINDTNNTIYDSQYTTSSIWVNNLQTQQVSSPGSFISLAPLPTTSPDIGSSANWLNMPSVTLITPSYISNGVAFTCSWSIINAPTGSYIKIYGAVVDNNSYAATTGSVTYTYTGLVFSNTYYISATLFSANGTILNTTSNTYYVYANQLAYTTAGTYSWVAPIGVTSVSVVAVGGGGGTNMTGFAGAAGGGLGWKNGIPVIPGQSYTVVVGGAGVGGVGGASYFIDDTTVAGLGGNLLIGGLFVPSNQGGAGGAASTANGASGNGGGGAGGYTGGGGAGIAYGTATTGGAGTGGGGAGSSGGAGTGAGGGGGVGLLGQGISGTGSAYGSRSGGGGGSGGADGGAAVGNLGGVGGAYGGGRGGNNSSATPLPIAGSGAVRIIWVGLLLPANTIRAFPSTNTGDL